MFVSAEPSNSENDRSSVPIFGAIFRAIYDGESVNFYFILIAILAVWILAIAVWGFAAFIIPMLFAVLVVFVTLIAITLGS